MEFLTKILFETKTMKVIFAASAVFGILVLIYWIFGGKLEEPRGCPATDVGSVISTDS